MGRVQGSGVCGLLKIRTRVSANESVPVLGLWLPIHPFLRLFHRNVHISVQARKDSCENNNNKAAPATSAVRPTNSASVRMMPAQLTSKFGP